MPYRPRDVLFGAVALLIVAGVLFLEAARVGHQCPAPPPCYGIEGAEFPEGMPMPPFLDKMDRGRR